MSHALANITDEAAVVAFNPKQLKIMKDSVFPGFTDDQLEYAIEFSQSLRLNPLKREIFMLKQSYQEKGSSRWLEKIIPYIPVQGYRVIAHRSRLLEEIIGPFLVDEHNVEHKILPPGSKLHAATAAIKRKDYPMPFWAVVYWIEAGGSEPKGQWAKMPRHMLGKTALARAFREAFPDELTGTYSEEEVETFADPSQMRVEVSQGYTRPDVKKEAPALSAPMKPPVQVDPEPEAEAEPEAVEKPKTPEEAKRAVLVEMVKSGMVRHTGTQTGKPIWKDVRAACSMIADPGPISKGRPDFPEWSNDQLEQLADKYASFETEPYVRPDGWEESGSDDEPAETTETETSDEDAEEADYTVADTEIDNPLA